MKSHLSITLDEQYAQALERISRRENRSLSSQIESIVADWLARQSASERILTTPGKFVGKFSREETYADD